MVSMKILLEQPSRDPASDWLPVAGEERRMSDNQPDWEWLRSLPQQCQGRRADKVPSVLQSFHPIPSSIQDLSFSFNDHCLSSVLVAYQPPFIIDFGHLSTSVLHCHNDFSSL
ncbi:hypothetical protein PGT21_005595 [Puccinia graminis f. sp. tritici]|uniref:Uncharacterized protein n=1 Tax=Puccinia graminis f. sp. tritici TaxID=56615 RepID=A0A5B0MEB7_PUCGR|nr:hypothetical protein PGT21_005595 [Puccinia graminis f. sp. tritici]